jgi:spore coat protein CotH
MKHYIQIQFVLLCLLIAANPTTGTSQDTTLDQSTLPIFEIDTKRQERLEPGFLRESDLYIYDNGGVNRITDAPTQTVKKIYAKWRGSSSLDFDKRNIGFEVRDSVTEEEVEVSILGMPKHDDWAIHGPYSDKSLMRNALAYMWARDIQPWAPRAQYVDVVLNDNYQGVYLFTEKVRRDNDRIDISKLNSDETSGLELTGGYILQVGDDVIAVGDGRSWNSRYDQTTSAGVFTQFSLEYPNIDSIGANQFDYIENYTRGIEDALAAANYTNPQTGYRNEVDLPSWVDHAIIQEITGNFDAFRRSLYILKDRDDDGGRFAGGPAWDFNIAFGNDSMCLGQGVEGWVMNEDGITCDKSLPFFVERIYEDPMYKARFRARWEGLRQNTLSDARINGDIDSLVTLLTGPQMADQARWNSIGTFVWPNAFVGQTWGQEVDYLRDWITRRVAWIDANVQAWPMIESLQSNNHSLPVMNFAVAGGDTIPTGRIDATLRVVNNGEDQLNSPQGAATGFNGAVAIELKGAADEKSAYSFELRDDSGDDYAYRLLDMPKEEDWELIGPYSDKTLLRNALAYDIAGDIMDYAPRTEPVVLYINNEYKGIYVLTESVKRDDSRIDIAKLNEDENSGDDLTGGYILELDSPSSNPDKGFSSDVDASAFYRYHTPDDGDITAQQKNYIQGEIDNFEQAVASGGFASARNLMDIVSMVDFMLIQELGANSKAYGTNTFLYKDKDSKNTLLHAGPVWDFNRGFGNDNLCGGISVEGWVVEENGRCGSTAGSVPFWWTALWEDTSFRSIVTSRWRSLRQNQLTNASLRARVDALSNPLLPEVDQNFVLYPILGHQIGRNAFVGNTYDEEVDFMRDWLVDRAIWMDGALGISSSTKDQLAEVELSVSPNPSFGSSSLTVNYDLGAVRSNASSLEVVLIDQLGRTIQSMTTQGISGRVEMPVRDLPAGVYFIQLLEDGRSVGVQKWLR